MATYVLIHGAGDVAWVLHYGPAKPNAVGM